MAGSGEMFEFGEESHDRGNPSMIRNVDQEKLKNAPANNIDSERDVGSVNYGRPGELRRSRLSAHLCSRPRLWT